MQWHSEGFGLAQGFPTLEAVHGSCNSLFMPVVGIDQKEREGELASGWV